MSEPTPSPPVHHAAGTELTAADLHAILRLRVDVFVVEQDCAYAELDGRDLEADTVHMWLADADGVAAYIRILADPPNGSGARRIGRVVTRPDRRGEQLSARLIREALDTLGPIDTRLEAQSHLVGYYQAFGYRIDGDEYIEDGIPHTPMVRPAPTGSTMTPNQESTP